nr:MAG TPA: hypothetical protein [Caudoviricetes sp.]
MWSPARVVPMWCGSLSVQVTLRQYFLSVGSSPTIISLLNSQSTSSGWLFLYGA